MSQTQTSATVGDALIALVRTVVPAIVGYLLALLAQAGFGLPPGAAPLADLILTAVFTAAYYALIRWLQAKWSWVGWLLGYPTSPSYDPRHAAD